MTATQENTVHRVSGRRGGVLLVHLHDVVDGAGDGSPRQRQATLHHRSTTPHQHSGGVACCCVVLFGGAGGAAGGRVIT